MLFYIWKHTISLNAPLVVAALPARVTELGPFKSQENMKNPSAGCFAAGQMC